MVDLVDALPLGKMMFLYVGTADFDRDFVYYKKVLGGHVQWAFKRFGAKVAAFELGDGPLVLIADHMVAPSCMPLFAVEDFESTIQRLRERGWKEERGPFEIPNGPCYVFKDESGNHYGIFENVRPTHAEESYRDPDNAYRII